MNCEILFSSPSPGHGRERESCASEAVLPPSHLQSDPGEAQVVEVPAEGSQCGTGKVQRKLCHNGHYSKALL